MNKSAHKYNKSIGTVRSANGFTLIELLLSVAVIGILSGALLSTINYNKQRQNADDSVRTTNLNKIVQSIEAYNISERRYPSDPNNDGNPSDDPSLSTYLQGGWLIDKPAGSVYTYYVNGSRDEAGVVVNANSGKVLKYRTNWGKIQTCASPSLASDDTCN